MTIHLVKLSVGSESLESLARWQRSWLEARRRAGEPEEIVHRTRMFPRRARELLDGGSIYWVIRGVILARQRILALRSVKTSDGVRRCDIVLEPTLHPVRPTRRRAFQGWRYLAPEDAPADLVGKEGEALAGLPAEMRAELMELGLV
jgi:hypothetical protein